MTPSHLASRQTLLSRSDAALDRWPDRKGSEFVREMTDVAEGLQALAHAADRTGNDALERARTWRHVGNAYFDLGASDPTQLEHSAAAFRNAEALLDAADDPVETMKLNYAFGQTLLLQSAAKDAELASEARNRLAVAVEL